MTKHQIQCKHENYDKGPNGKRRQYEEQMGTTSRQMKTVRNTQKINAGNQNNIENKIKVLNRVVNRKKEEEKLFKTKGKFQKV
jgi:hypothetical protein